MAKNSTYPTFYDEALQVSITKLKEWGYLTGKLNNGTISWSKNGNIMGSISIMTNIYAEQPYIELDYTHSDKARNYKILLVKASSNLQKGVVWYFLCPHTNKRCRKLYLISGYFLHREAFKGCMYEKQTQSKRSRATDKIISIYCKTDALYNELHKKHFKRTYAGKQTKRYLRIIKQLHKTESITHQDIEKAILNF